MIPVRIAKRVLEISTPSRVFEKPWEETVLEVWTYVHPEDAGINARLRSAEEISEAVFYAVKDDSVMMKKRGWTPDFWSEFLVWGEENWENPDEEIQECLHDMEARVETGRQAARPVEEVIEFILVTPPARWEEWPLLSSGKWILED
jgi:hypothetical protein